MADLIDRQALLNGDDVCRVTEYDEAGFSMRYKAVPVEAIRQVPTIEAEPVKHGRWCWEGKFKACSNCGSYVEWNETLGANFWKFCPYCGAKMDLEG